MKNIDVLATAILFLLPGAIAPVYAQGREQEKQPEQKQQQQAKPAQKQQQAKPAAQAQHAQKQQQAKPAAQQAKPAAQPQRAQKEQQAKPAARQQQQASRTQPAGGHGSIPDAKFRASFGRGHTFHVNRSDFAGGGRNFQYGGYSFALVEPWPVAWLYTDNVYVDFLNGGYVLVDPLHPGVYLSISIG
jgi:hypothetical protein